MISHFEIPSPETALADPDQSKTLDGSDSGFSVAAILLTAHAFVF
jgi:hypothetical protein